MLLLLLETAVKIRLIVTGRAYHTAAGLPTELEVPEDATLKAAIDQVNALLPDDAPLPESCLISVSGQHAGTVGRFEDRTLQDGQEVTFVAPVAGG